MTQQLLLDILPGAVPTLDGFVPGGNAAAVASIRALSPGHAVYLWGSAGSGRSHLLRARAQGQGCHYLDARAPVHLLRALATDEDRTLALVAVDDVGDLNDAGQAALFALFNRWRAAATTSGAFALLTSGGRAPLTMPLREDLRTRLGWGIVHAVQPLAERDVRVALQQEARRRGLALGDDVLDYLLTRFARDLKSLMHLLHRLDGFALAEKRAVTVPLLRRMLNEEGAAA